MQLSIVGFAEGKRCDNCGKEADAFHVRCEAGMLDADLCVKCLARQCRMRAKAQGLPTDATDRAASNGGAP